MNLTSKKIYPIYFSSKKHFEYLIISLKTLVKLNSSFIGNIYVYVDEDDFLDEKQINEIKDLNKEIIIRKTKYITHTGKKLILSELKAFDEVSKEINVNDYIAKTDSDIIFLNDNIFKSVIESNMILIGFEEVRSLPSFIQGGLYFIRSNFVKEIINFDESIFERVKDKFILVYNNSPLIKDDSYHEDVIIYNIIKEKTDKILFVPYMMIPGVYKTKDPSVIHFVGTKEAMKFYFYAKDFGFLLYLIYFKLSKVNIFIKLKIIYLIGYIGLFMRNKIPFIYKILKPYFPDRK